jgi:hypothetical protein
MKELLEKLEANFDRSEGWIQIVAAEWGEDDLLLTLFVQFHGDHKPEFWRITCSNVIKESLCSNGTGSLAISSCSPLLKPFVEREVDITYFQNELSRESLFGIVYSCCMEVIGRPDHIPGFVSQLPTAGGYGLLGRFPESLAMRILEVLKNHPIVANASPGNFPKHWNGSQYVDYPPLQVLEIGQPYVIAEKFSACRI